MKELTAEQKMQILAELTKSGANISQINLGDGTQNFYIGKEQKEKSHMTCDAEVADTEEVADAEAEADSDAEAEADSDAETEVDADTAETYPEVTELQRNFFRQTVVIKGELPGQRSLVLELPLEWLMHAIHDLTTQWHPSEKSSVHRWKLLYELLHRLKYFRIEQKQRYKAFVKAVVRYCFPDVPDGYSNNLSKSKLEEHFADWSNEDKALYSTLKQALTPPERVP